MAPEGQPKETEKEKEVAGYHDPYYLSSSDNHTMQVGAMIFNGGNYLNWSRSAKMGLASKNKLGYINGKIKRPKLGSNEYFKWDRNDNMVRCWILKSLKENIAGSLMNMKSAKDLWDEIAERYAQSNAPQIYQLKKELNDLEQNEMSVCDYYCKLRSYWDQLDDLEGIPECSCGAMSKCSCDIEKKMLQMQERGRLNDFLMGLNGRYENMRGNILGMDPLPSVNRAYHLVQQIELQKQMTYCFQSTPESSALAANRQSHSLRPLINFQKKDYKKIRMEKLSKKCDHCGMKGHVQEECYKLIGYPADWNKKPRERFNPKYAGNVIKYDGKEERKMQDPSFISTIVQQVVKAMSEQCSGSGQSSNFASILSASNVAFNTEFFDSGSWIIDSGASDHMAGNMDLFSEVKGLKQTINVGLPDGSTKIVKKIGVVRISPKITLMNVLYIPEFQHNLLSLSKLIDHSKVKIVFDENGCVLQDPISKEAIAYGRRLNGLYKFCLKPEKKEERSCSDELNNKAKCNATNSNLSLSVIHARLGHGSLSKLQHLKFCDCKNVKVFDCDTCCVAKHHRLPFPISNSMAGRIFELIHVDLWRPYRVPNISGDRYFLTIVDDYSRATWTHLLKSKDKVKDVIERFLAYGENQFNSKVKIVRSDNGTEIMREECDVLFGMKGIIHQRSVAGVPQQNARVERKHRFLLETARALRIHAGLPKFLWGECILAATHLINLLPSVVINWETPYERWKKKEPSYDHLRIIGCLCYGKSSDRRNDKFEGKGIRSILVGYPYGQKGYKLYDLQKGQTYVSRDVVFKENIFPFLLKKGSENELKVVMNQVPLFEEKEDSQFPVGDMNEADLERETDGDAMTTENIEAGDQQNMEGSLTKIQSVRDEPMIVRRSTRERHVPSKLKDFAYQLPKNSEMSSSNMTTHIGDHKLCDMEYYSPDYVISLHNAMQVKEPCSYKQAAQDEGWKQAMEEELAALEKNETWEWKELPPGKKAIDSKWVYKVKLNKEGKVERLKARLVARGDKQEKGKDYKHTFSPVAKFTTVRMVFALATLKDWKLHQLDINNAFLHGFIEEDLYMKAPQGCHNVPAGMVCKLRKSIYGLKQASRQWNLELTKFLKSRGFHQS